MYIVDMYLRVRRACLVEGMSIREASRVFGLHRDTVRKMLSHPVPPGYRRKRPPHRPKLEPYTGVIDRILEDDLSVPKKQRHTAKRIFERLRDEHGFDGGYTIVKDIVRILHLAATTMECEVEMALRRLLESRVRFDYAVVRQLAAPASPEIPEVELSCEVDLGVYDRLLTGGAR